jgi:alpha-mannosidase
MTKTMANADFSTLATSALSTTIAHTAQRLRNCTQRSHQAGWHWAQIDGSPTAVLNQTDWQQWPLAPRNAKDHIAWPRGQQPLWLCQAMTVPPTLNGFSLEGLSLRLGLTWWAEAVAVYVNGHLVQEGDLFDYFARVPLSDRVVPGDTFIVAIHMRSPGHDEGALVRSDAIYESTDAAFPEPGFVADELTVLQTYAEKLAPQKLSEMARAIAPLDLVSVADTVQLQQTLAVVRERLMPFSPWIKQRQITCVGHAHLDLAWLWPVEDTWRAAERTFRSVLSLQAAFPNLTYTHSSPALFEWLETHQPQLFQAVQTAVKQGSWSIDAGFWVEPELNTIGGESLARQILYGQRYSRSRFGKLSAIAWLPDSFGFSWQLPQLLKLGGIDYFATQKLRWNEATSFPHSLFWWQGLDGTVILSLTLPPIGTDVDPVQMVTHSTEWEAKTGLTEILWLPGMGDHGGGPTRDMLEKAARWSTSPFFPRLTFASPQEHLQRLSATIDPFSEDNAISTNNPLAAPTSASSPHQPLSPLPHPLLPTWNDELYLELHRGCYTVHADQKWYNRRCEDALREAELFATLAHMQGAYEYPQAALEKAWKRVLFNQFHDILPGTAIPEVFATTNSDWQAAYDTAIAIRTRALQQLTRHLPPGWPPQPEAIPVFVFNSLNWAQRKIIELDLSNLSHPAVTWQIFDPDSGQTMVSQITSHIDLCDTPPGQTEASVPQGHRLLFWADVPPIGYRLYWLIPNSSTVPEPSPTNLNGEFRLDNGVIQAAIDPTTGDLRELQELQQQRNVVRSPANHLQAFRDAGQYWDAWDIAPDYQDQPLPAARLRSIAWLERGPLRQRIRVVRQIADSTLQQDYILDHGSPYLKVATVADWWAHQVVLKAAFPVSFETDYGTYEIPFGAISRPTRPTTPHEQAKWEVPAYRWADVNDGTVGLSILTDYKHGFDAQPDQLRLTLLKAPIWPDPQADRGQHRFTYALYPHAGDWRSGQTPHWAIAFNTPLHAVLGSPQSSLTTTTEPGDLPQNHPVWHDTLLNWRLDDVHLAALKRSEDEADQYILRVWEMYGHETILDPHAPPLERTNLLELPISVELPYRLAPWQIATFKGSAFNNNSLRRATEGKTQD